LTGGGGGGGGEFSHCSRMMPSKVIQNLVKPVKCGCGITDKRRKEVGEMKTLKTIHIHFCERLI